MSKKKKKIIAKRRAQAEYKKQKKSKSGSAGSKPDTQFIYRPALSDIVAPPGYRAISASQAMMEYALPVMDFAEKGIIKDPNKALQLTMLLWNYKLSHEKEKMKTDIVKQMEKILKINKQEAAKFFEMMIQRKDYLFPDEMQPENPMTMFIRKEKRYLIPEFNYDALNVLEKSIPSDDEDKKLVQLINQMDKYVAEEMDYDKWEEHYLTMQEKSKERFNKWLIDKGIKEYSEDFPFYLEIYLNFIYRYIHDDIINLKTRKSLPTTSSVNHSL